MKVKGMNIWRGGSSGGYRRLVVTLSS